MKNTNFQTISLWLLILAPYIFLYFQFDSMPDKVPMHYNIRGEADRWGSKESLWLIPCAIPFFVYLLMKIIPKIDPKKKIQYMGSKYQQFHFMLILFMSALSIFIMYSAAQGETNASFIFVLLGLLTIGLGNYFQSIRPNYFIGLRTPWTLENDKNWNKTHRFAGKLWIVCGLLIVISSLTIKEKPWYPIAFSILIATMVIVPVIYSYLFFKKNEKQISS